MRARCRQAAGGVALLPFLLGSFGCSSTETGNADQGSGVPGWQDAAARQQPPVRVSMRPNQNLGQQLRGLPADVLLPAGGGRDDVVVKVGDLQIRKSHVYDRMAEMDSLKTKDYVDLLVFDALLFRQAKLYGITVDSKLVDAAVATARRSLTAEVERQWGAGASTENYYRMRFGMGSEAHWRMRRLELARDLYRSYVIRYLALREEQVVVRILTHRDRKVVEDVKQRVKAGADFKSLVLQLSEDTATKNSGGLMAPFTREDPRRITKEVFALQAGELSKIGERAERGRTYYYVLYCIKRMAGRKVPFAQVRDEIHAELRRNPVRPEEKIALHLNLRSRAEKLSPTPRGR